MHDTLQEEEFSFNQYDKPNTEHDESKLVSFLSMTKYIDCFLQAGMSCLTLLVLKTMYNCILVRTTLSILAKKT